MSYRLRAPAGSAGGDALPRKCSEPSDIGTYPAAVAVDEVASVVQRESPGEVMAITPEQAHRAIQEIDAYTDDLREVRSLLYTYANLHDQKREEHALEIEGLLLRMVEASESFTAAIYKLASGAIHATRAQPLEERRRWLGFLRDRW